MSYGQYSEASTAGRRLTNPEKRRNAPRFVPTAVHNETGVIAGLDTVKNMGHNRALLTYSDGTQGYMLHTTVVAWRTPAGRIRLDSGGWRTVTTRAAMNEALKLWTGEFHWVSMDCRVKSKSYGSTSVMGKFYTTDAFWLDI